MRQCILYFSSVFLLFFYSQQASASLMRFSFTGVISDVTNQSQSLWEPQALIGETVTGEFLMDTSSPIGGRLETGWYWWWVNDNEPPVLTSQIRFSDNTYQLHNEGIYNEEYDEYVPNEYIAMSNGPDYDGGPVGDGIRLNDYARFDEETANGTISSFFSLEYWFTDYLRDFLTFPEQTTIPVEIPPNFEQLFTWTDDDLNDDTARTGIGSLRYYESQYNPDDGFNTLYDSTVSFDLTRVEASRVPAPQTLFLVVIAASLLFLRRNQKHS